jgi:FAD synthase
MIRLRGTVDTGYGCSEKKLGFPMANVPSYLIQNALSGIATGVHFGGVVIEGSRTGRNAPHKAVASIGYSPTLLRDMRKKLWEPT